MDSLGWMARPLGLTLEIDVQLARARLQRALAHETRDLGARTSFSFSCKKKKDKTKKEIKQLRIIDHEDFPRAYFPTLKFCAAQRWFY